jgi:hypothetical protein
MFSSKKGKENTSVKEQRKLWKDYVTKASNKINLNKLPKEFHSIHLLASKAELVRTQDAHKVSGQKTKPSSKSHLEGREGIRMGDKKTQKLHGRKRKAVSSDDDEKHQRSALEGMRMGDNKTQKIPGRKRKSGSSEEDEKPRRSLLNCAKHINLETTAKRLWRERYGENLLDIKPFGDSYKNIGIVWTMCVDVQERSVYTTTDYSPSVLDESMVALPEEEEEATTVPDKQRFAFRNQKIATRALYWWIICTVPTVGSRRKWGKDMLGEHTSAVLYTTQSRVWSILSRGDDGSIWWSIMEGSVTSCRIV